MSGLIDLLQHGAARVRRDSFGNIAGILGPDGKAYASNAFDRIHPGTVVSTLAGDGTPTLASANAGEAVAVEDVNGMPMIKCTLSTTAGLVFQCEHILPSPVFLGFANSIQVPIKFLDMSTTEIANGAVVQIWMYGETSGLSVRYQCSLAEQEPGLFVASLSRDMLVASGGAPTTQLDGERVSKYRIIITAGTSGTAGAPVTKAPIWIGPITSNRRRHKGRVLIYLDGEYDSQQKFLLPMLDRYGLKANLAVTNKNFGQPNYMTKAQIAAAYANGHTIVHHTFGNKSAGWNNVTDYQDRQSITDDVNSGFGVFQTEGWLRGIGHCVNGYTSAFTSTTDNARQLDVSAALTAAGVKTCRVGGKQLRSSTNLDAVGMLFPAAHPKANWRRMYGGIQISGATTDQATAAQAIAVIDAAEKRGELASILWHKLVLEAATPGSLEQKISEANTVIEYIADRTSRGGVINETVDSAYANLKL